ncbi:hypothetical protein EZS27_000436 [termite gut metagenome]|uniref:Uncharacterized protein n=1 Tax=termite gut metagenome TaxID=433724 RepID=A0A5J4T1J8_9ZZZZ
MKTLDKIRNILNIIFLIGSFTAIIIYFVKGEDKTLFLYVCGGAIFFKLIEFTLRFTHRK